MAFLRKREDRRSSACHLFSPPKPGRASRQRVHAPVNALRLKTGEGWGGSIPADESTRLGLYSAPTVSLMYKGGEAVTAVSVQGRLRLGGAWGGGWGGGGLRLASTTGEKQGDENECETMKWFEFFHDATVSNAHATSFSHGYKPPATRDTVSKTRRIGPVFGKNITRQTQHRRSFSLKGHRIHLPEPTILPTTDPSH